MTASQIILYAYPDKQKSIYISRREPLPKVTQLPREYIDAFIRLPSK